MDRCDYIWTMFLIGKRSTEKKSVKEQNYRKERTQAEVSHQDLVTQRLAMHHHGKDNDLVLKSMYLLNTVYLLDIEVNVMNRYQLRRTHESLLGQLHTVSTLWHSNLPPTYGNHLNATHLAKETPNFQGIVKAKVTDIRKSTYREV